MLVRQKSDVPQINPEELQAFVQEVLPDANVRLLSVNPEYHFWRLEINNEQFRLEYVWGPECGFGFTDVDTELGPEDNPFAPYEITLHSMAEAKQSLIEKIQSDS